MPKLSLQSRVMTRAAELLGGPDMLAARLSVSTLMVRAWSTDALPVPRHYFFRVVQILDDADPDPAAFRSKLKNEQPPAW